MADGRRRHAKRALVALACAWLGAAAGAATPRAEAQRKERCAAKYPPAAIVALRSPELRRWGAV
jgi:hypothetical protein